MINKKILVIIPAFNEEENIAETLNSLNSLEYGPWLVNSEISLLVVDDCSNDKTLKIAEESGCNVISLPYNLGIGGAVQTGFKFASRNGFDIAVQVDGDNQHNVDFIKTLLEPVIKDEADMTIGSRFLPPFIGYRSSFIRRVGIHFFSKLISFITDYEITDPTSGFRAFNTKMIKVFSEYYPQDFPEPEAIAVAGRHDARIKEIPVEMRARRGGRSSIRYFNTLYYMIKVSFALLLDKLKKRRVASDDN